MSLLFRLFGKGLIVILPFVLVIWLLYFLFGMLNSLWAVILSFVSFAVELFANEKIDTQVPSIIVSIGLLVFMILLILYVGYRLEKKQNAIFIKFGELIVSKIPFIGSVYATIKDIVSMLGGSSKDKYLGVAFVPFGENELIGFITQEEGEYFWVFCPFAPPTSGLLFRIHKDKLKKSDMSVSDGLKKIVSFGVK